MQFAAIFPHGEAVGRQYLRSINLPIDLVLGDVRPPWSHAVTPTLAVCDSNGTILRVWVGLLGENEQRDLRALLEAREAAG